MGGEGVDDKNKKVKYLGFKDEGFEADAVVNFLAMIGWTPKNDKELLTMKDLISEFRLDDVHKASARYDIDKAKYFNTLHLTQNRDMESLLKNIDLGGKKFTDNQLAKIVDLAKKRSTFAKDMQTIVNIFTKPVSISERDRAAVTSDFKSVMSQFIQSPPSDWVQESIKKKIFDICEEKKIKMGKIMPSLRVALTGNIPGPDLMTTAEILGKDESISRIKKCL